MSSIEKKSLYNILLITCDQLRYFRDDEWPEGFTLPNMECLKTLGTSFENHYICTSICTSSRASMYTGLHMPVHGMFDNTKLPAAPSRLSAQHKTLGHWLSEVDYYAAYKGKWHLDYEMEAPYHQTGRPPAKDFDARKEMKDRYGFDDYDGEVSSAGLPLSGYYHDGSIAASAIGWLRCQGQELNNAGRPWFLAVNFVNPHDIMFFGHTGQVKDEGNRLMMPHGEPDHDLYRPQWRIEPNSWQQPLATSARPPAHQAFYEANNLFIGPIDYQLTDWWRYNSFYLNSTRLLDRQLGYLIQELEALGLTRKTIILFTSDHGELAGAHGLKGKGPVIYEEAIHVPMIMAHPDHPGGQRCRALTSHIDLLPTILANTAMTPDLQARVAKELPGQDITPLLADPETGKLRDALLFTFNMLLFLDTGFIRSRLLNRQRGTPLVEPNINRRGAIRMVFDGHYKFARYFAPREHNTPRTMEALLAYNDLELYDLHQDIRETLNPGADPIANEELIIAMNDRLTRLIESEIGEDKGEMLPRRENGGLWCI